MKDHHTVIFIKPILWVHFELLSFVHVSFISSKKAFFVSLQNTIVSLEKTTFKAENTATYYVNSPIHTIQGVTLWFRAWSLIRNEKTIILFERNCH
jgi:hypothetical protein